MQSAFAAPRRMICLRCRRYNAKNLAFPKIEQEIFMTRYAIALLVLSGAALLFAQTKKAPEKDPVPSKVSGPAKTTASGVEYWDIKVGTGAVAETGKTATVHYTGWLTSGKKFDSSYDDDEPLDFSVGRPGIIQGWNEGVVGMKVGGKRQLKIPPSAAYGAKGSGNVIPPNATLIFDIELLAVK
jgi:FKBP-type peptidyl-prolyl cis-trans isomerase